MALVQKSFSDIITFSRSSNATRVGPTGLVEYAPHNLLTYSEQFDNAIWAKVGATVTANAAAAPNGTVTADSVAAFGGSYIENPASTTARTSTGSVYVKGSGQTIGKTIRLRLVRDAYAELVTGPEVTLTSSWQRISLTGTFNNAPSTVRIRIDFTPTGGASGDETLIWGAQLSVGPYALDYTPTTSAAVYGPRFDYNGSGVTIVEPVSRNLLTYSEQFDNAAWTAVDGLSSTVTANATAAPDGTITADKIVETAVTGYMLIRQTASLVANTAYTISFYAKAAERSFARILFDTAGFGGSSWYATFNLTNGTVVTNTSATIVSVGNGWYRCSATAAPIGTGSYPIYYGPAPSATTGYVTYGGVAGSGIFVWGAQLEVGSTATAYMASGATNGFRAVPVVSGSATARGLLVEEQRTNLLTYSEQFDNAAWVKSNTTITANAATSPDGTVNADTLLDNTVNNAHFIYQSNTVSGANTASVFAKAAGRNFVMLRYYIGSSNWVTAVFNLSTGVVSQTSTGASSTFTGVSASIQAFGNGWYRCILTATGTSILNLVVALSNTATPTLEALDGTFIYTGDGSSGVHIWGAQLEAGSFATSLIPTLASTVTRSADVASVNTLSPFYNAVEGSLYGEFEVRGLTGGLVQINDGTNNYADSIIFGEFGASNSYGLRVFVSTTSQADFFTTDPAVGSIQKFAGGFKANDFGFTKNGSATSTDTSGSLPTGATTLKIGRAWTGNPANMWIRRLAFYPRKLSSAELQALTA